MVQTARQFDHHPHGKSQCAYSSEVLHQAPFVCCSLLSTAAGRTYPSTLISNTISCLSRCLWGQLCSLHSRSKSRHACQACAVRIQQRQLHILGKAVKGELCCVVINTGAHHLCFAPPYFKWHDDMPTTAAHTCVDMCTRSLYESCVPTDSQPQHCVVRSMPHTGRTVYFRRDQGAAEKHQPMLQSGLPDCCV